MSGWQGYVAPQYNAGRVQFPCASIRHPSFAPPTVPRSGAMGGNTPNLAHVLLN